MQSGNMHLNAVSHQTSPPILRLPYDLLLNVFRLDAGSGTGKHWTRLLQVCRHWHRHACASPVLWRVIEIKWWGHYHNVEARTRQLNKLSLFIRRAANATLDVSLSLAGDDIDAFFTLLLPHAARLRKFVAPCIERRFRAAVEELLRLPMGNLEELDVGVLLVKGNYGEDKDPQSRVETRLPPESFRQLRRLCLKGFSDLPQLPRTTLIRTLILEDLDLDRTSTRDDVLNLLSACPLLETLHFVQIRTDLPRSPEKRMIPLHNLQVLYIAGTLNQIRFLLSAIDARPAAMTVAAHGVTARTHRGVVDLLPPPLSRYPALSTASDLRLDWGPHAYNLCASHVGLDSHAHPYGFSAPGLRIGINFAEWQLPPVDAMLDGVARDLCTLFGGAPVTSLSFMFRETFITHHAERVLRAFPALRILRIEEARPLRPILDVLAPGEHGVAAPRLETLILADCTVRDDEVRSCFALRHACQGVDRLQELHIGPVHFTLEELRRSRAEYQKPVQGLVGEFEHTPGAFF